MIAFDFEYYRPASLSEAVYTYFELEGKGKAPIYYGGGTEIISLARVNRISAGSVIDIKDIPECNILEAGNNEVITGSAVTLTRVCESNIFPLLSKVARRAADHTARNKITLGGNICGRLPYREAVLPFLIGDSQAVIAGETGTRIVPINSIFDVTLNLQRGEFLVQIKTEKKYVSLPFEAVKITKQEKVDYPLVTAAVVKDGSSIRAAFSGVCEYPFRSLNLEQALSSGGSFDDIKGYLPGRIPTNLQASSEYREFVFKNLLSDIMQRIGGKDYASNA